MSRRGEIRMTEAELHRFLEEERTLTCATIGPNGRPHLMPLWYVVTEGSVMTAWTYGASQKTRNLERLPQATVQVEAGRAYEELRGAMFECDVEIIRDATRLVPLGFALARRYRGLPDGVEPPPEVRAFVEQQARKRVGLRFHPTRTVTWDHRKLGGGY